MKSILSVCLITYNHEGFIKETISGIINQKTKFPFELIISNDASTDNTNHKILRATETLPEHITLRYFNHKTNLGMISNCEYALNACLGKYIAVCEGDDYWVDNKKLQKQVDFLEANFEYNLVTGNVRQYSEFDKRFTEPDYLKSFSFNYKDMLIKNHCSTCTTMFRNFILFNKPLVLKPDLGADFQIWMLALGKDGKAMKSDEVLAVYRRHANSATGIRNRKLGSFKFFRNMVSNKIRIVEYWNNYFDSQANFQVLKFKSDVYKKMAKVAYKRKIYSFFIIYIIYFKSYEAMIKLGFGEGEIKKLP